MDLRLDNYKTQSRHTARAFGACSIPSKWRVILLFSLFLLPILLFADYKYHTVRKGDTLYALSKRYGVTVAQIQKLNNMSGTNLSIGQRLKIKEIPKAKPKPPPPPPAAEPAPAEQPATPAVEPSASQQEAPAAAQVVELPIEYYHIVKPKDNPYRISQNYGISSKDFFAWNGKSGWDDFDIHPGDKLVIKDPATYVPSGAEQEQPQQSTGTPSQQAAAEEAVVVSKTYKVRKGDTLYSIAKAHGTTVDDLKTRNNLSSNSIFVGQNLYIVGSPGSSTLTPSVTLSDLEGTQMIRDDLFLPVQGRVTSEFGLRRGRPHKGIDIAAKSGTPIYAVLDGVVVFSGVQRGYGNVIVLEHPDFVMTVYAHNERNLVSLGDEVKKGQQIAEVGNTGKSTGPHLHFEYRIKGQAINPRKVLNL
jgi:murein DD-endopeptidase MepM/ murein hydrolase activator NlpD